MADYEFSLPWPPSVNGYWRAFQNRQIISKRGREYRAKAIKELERLGLSGELVSERLLVSAELHPPTRRKYDIDNFLKGVFDALSKADFWLDDEQVDICHVEKCSVEKGGCIQLKITKL